MIKIGLKYWIYAVMARAKSIWTLKPKSKVYRVKWFQDKTKMAKSYWQRLVWTQRVSLCEVMMDVTLPRSGYYILSCIASLSAQRERESWCRCIASSFREKPMPKSMPTSRVAKSYRRVVLVKRETTCSDGSSVVSWVPCVKQQQQWVLPLNLFFFLLLLLSIV